MVYGQAKMYFKSAITKANTSKVGFPRVLAKRDESVVKTIEMTERLAE